MKRQKYYVVWKGRKRGVFTSWDEAEMQVKGFQGAEYKAFDSVEEAKAAFEGVYETYKGTPMTSGKWKTASVQPVTPSICVDAACSGSPGPVEYRGLLLPSGEELFRAGPFKDGTNNVGEFLAIVRALTWLEKHQKQMPVYSDSESAIAWVNNGRANTKLSHGSENSALFALIRSAENWLAENELADDEVMKWDTESWGENPADFGRK